MSRDEDFVDIEGDDEELSYINRDTSVEKMEEDSLAQDLQITPENSDDESIGSCRPVARIERGGGHHLSKVDLFRKK